MNNNGTGTGTGNGTTTSNMIVTGLVETVRAITNQDWDKLGSSKPPFEGCGAPETKEEIAERISGLLLVQLTALVAAQGNNEHHGTVVFRANDLRENDDYVANVPKEVRRQLVEYVTTILNDYNEVHYHSVHHCYHVVISANKLLDELLRYDEDDDDEQNVKRKKKRTFGIRSDPLYGLGLLFAALIHDAGHQGVSNAQLVEELDDLAMIHNDQSVAEQHAISVGFREIMKPRYKALYDTMFRNTADFRRFRQLVIDLVLCTDIASPERMEIIKRKWRLVFGSDYGCTHHVGGDGDLAGEEQSVPEKNEDEDEEEYISSTTTSLSDLDENEEKEDKSGLEENPKQEKLSPLLSRLYSSSFRSSTQSHRSSIMSALSELTEDDADAAKKEEIVKTYDNQKETKRVVVGLTRPKPLTVRCKTEPSVRTIDSKHTGTSFQFLHNSLPQQKDLRKSPRLKLGIGMSMDLSGNVTDLRKSSLFLPSLGASKLPNGNNGDEHHRSSQQWFDDEPDEYAVTVLLETMLKVADVSSMMQDWDRYKCWSSRLYFELRHAYEQGRNPHDPARNWFEAQILFWDGYVTPLAKRLESTGAFFVAQTVDHDDGLLLRCVADNRARWLKEGREFTAWLAKKWSVVREEERKKKPKKRNIVEEKACLSTEGDDVKHSDSESRTSSIMGRLKCVFRPLKTQRELSR